MQTFTVHYQEDEVMYGVLLSQARRLHLTPEQLIRRILARELGGISTPLTTIRRERDRDDFWLNNGALTSPFQREVRHGAV